MKYLTVTWADATTWAEARWKPTSEVVTLTPDVGTFKGWLLAEQPEYLIFATHRMGEGEDVSWDGELCLPRGCIISMVEAEDGKRGSVPGGRRSGRVASGQGKGMGPKKRRRGG